MMLTQRRQAVLDLYTSGFELMNVRFSAMTASFSPGPIADANVPAGPT